MVYRDCNTVQSWAYGAQSFEGCRVEDLMDLRAYETYREFPKIGGP